jgi:chromosome partitioning protein
MLGQYKDYSEVLIPNVRPRLDLLPSTLDDEADEMLDSRRLGADMLLKDILSPARNHYDYCVIDTPPSLRTPTINGLVVTDLAIIPVEPSFFSLFGVGQVLRKIVAVRGKYQPEMHIFGLSVLHTEKQSLDKQIRDSLIENMGADLVFETKVPRLTAVGQASAAKGVVVEMAPESAASMAFHRLVKEIRVILNDEQETAKQNQRQSR